MTGSLLNIATTGLRALQTALDVTSQNVVNAANPNYTLQKVEIASVTPQFLGGLYIGNGVEVTGISQVTDALTETILRNNISNQSQTQAYAEYAARINSVLSDTQTGLSNSLNDFTSALQELSDSPQSTNKRTVFLGKANLLTNRFSSIDNSLIVELENINQQTNTLVQQVNSYTSQIAQLNLNILAAQSSSVAGAQPNDLLDQRATVLTQLAGIVNINTFSPGDGTLTVVTNSGLSLVLGGSSSQFITQINPNDALVLDIAIPVVGGNSAQVVTTDFTGGQMGGLAQVRSELIDTARNGLGRVAITLAQSFNIQHQLGVDLNGNLGTNFFSDMNETIYSQDRVVTGITNLGTLNFNANINPITQAPTGPYSIVANGVNLTTTTGNTLSTLSYNGVLTINGVSIRPTTVADDGTGHSTTDLSASAIAISKAINDSLSTSGVTDISADPATTMVYLGAYTAGSALTGNQFQINGQNVVLGANATPEMVVAEINALTNRSPGTGVIASQDNFGNITLAALDGRNIQLQFNGTASTTTFANFSLTGATAVDKVQRAQVNISSQTKPITIGGDAPSNVGLSTGTTPAASTSLTDSDYVLSTVGDLFILTRSTDNTIVASQIAFDVNNPIVADGFTLLYNSGTMQANDSFIIRPTRGGASNINLEINNINFLALASPLVKNSTSQNATINLGSVLNTSGLPAPTSSLYNNAFASSGVLSPPITVTFITPTTFQIKNSTTGATIGPVQNYVSGQDIFPLTAVVDGSTGASTVYDPGYRFNISGIPAAGDIFTIDYNSGASSADATNLNALINILQQPLLNNNTATISQVYGQVVTNVGNLTANMQASYSQAQTLTRASQANRDSISGVNLEEECSNLIQYQQIFQASSKMIAIQREIFDTLLDAIR